MARILRHAQCTSSAISRPATVPYSRLYYGACLLGGLSALLSGCMTSLAVATLPDRAKLEPLPDRYFRLAIEVVLDGKPRTVEHIWRCTHEKAFSAAVGWTLVWRSEGLQYVAKVIDKDLVIFFREPTSNHCYRVGKFAYASDIGVIPNPSTLDNLFVHHVEQFPRSGAIVGSSIERLDHDPKVPGPSLKEMTLEAGLRTYENDLVSSSVTIIPESIWSRYPKLDSYFRSLEVLTVAPYPTDPNQPLGFPIWRGSPLSKDDVHKRTYYSVQDIDGTIRFDPSRVPEQWVVFRRDLRDFRRSTTFCYAERCVPLSGMYNEIYDPGTRNVIGVLHSSPLRNELQ